MLSLLSSGFQRRPSARRGKWPLGSSVVCLLSVWIATFPGLCRAAQPSYSITDLGYWQPAAINNNGQIAGTSQVQAAVYDQGMLRYLDGPGFNSRAHDINDKGQVVGDYERNGKFRGFLYSDGVMQDIGNADNELSIAYAINARGDIVGMTQIPGLALHAFLYNKTGMHDLGGPGGDWSIATDINDAGQITGLYGSGSWRRAAPPTGGEPT